MESSKKPDREKLVCPSCGSSRVRRKQTTIGLILILVALFVVGKETPFLNKNVKGFDVNGFIGFWIAVAALGLFLWTFFRYTGDCVCRACGKTFEHPEEKIKVVCPKCSAGLLGATAGMIGDLGVCPKCKAEFIIEECIGKQRAE
jgi:DNA-directed RNA polymerase subunit RPC12/RpoP